MSESEESFAAHDIPMQTNNEDEGVESGSVYSASQSPEIESSSQGSPSTRGRTQKRRARDHSTSSYSRVKRVKSFYNDEYRILFNDTLEDIVSNETPLDRKLTPSQIGVSLWSSQEKEFLFSSLARRGRHDIQSLASDVGSKSESEVAVFLKKIQDAANEEQMYELATKMLLKPHEIDAALEISEDCYTSLDKAAEALSVLQQRENERLERKNYGDFSILTGKSAKWVERRLRSDNLDEAEVENSVPGAVLLNLKTCLLLSKRIFMNSSVMENNWRSYVDRSKAPSIMYTAFSDFHNLLISTTKRLVQSSLFFAMSRLRAIDIPGQKRPSQHVKRLDVVAALNVLNMPRNSAKVWAGTARKCRLRVYENVRRRQVSRKRYSYDEVEEILDPKQPRSRGRSSTRMTEEANVSESSHCDSEESSPAEETEDSKSSASSAEDNDSKTSSNNEGVLTDSNNESPDKQEFLEKAQNLYAEALDQQASQAEERRLWELLGEDPATKMKDTITELPKAPASERKDKDDLVDWTDRIDYMPEWEQFETPVPASSFVENRRHRRKFSREVESTGSDTDSEDLEQSSESEAQELEASPSETSTRRRSRSQSIYRNGAASELMGMASEKSASSEDDDDDGGSSTPSVEYAEENVQVDADGTMDESSDEDAAIDERRRGRGKEVVDSEKAGDRPSTHFSTTRMANESEEGESDSSIGS